MLTFLQKLFNESDGSHILIWHNKLSYYFKFNQAKEIKDRFENKKDVYIGVNTREDSYGKNKRGGKDTIDKVYSLWMDLDIQGGDHQKDNLFADLSSFFDIIEKNKLYKPSMTVETGGGYHLYWIFKEPYIIETKQDRIKIEAICKEWQKLFSDLAGKTIDATWNIDRVLRLPKTINGKYGNPVAIKYKNDSSYLIDDFERLTGDISGAEREISNRDTQQNDNFDFIIKKNAEPPFKKFRAMVQNVDGFEETWEHKRKDMEDNSQSGYDLSLATTFVKAEWSDQEIVDSLVSNRLEFGNNPDKIHRKDYYARTLYKAKQTMEIEEAHDKLDSYSVLSKEERQKKRGQIRNHLSSAIGIEIERIIKYTRTKAGEPSEYIIYANGKSIELPDVSYLIHQRKFDKVVSDMLGYRMKHIKSKRWREISQYLLDICLEVELGIIGTTYGMILYMIGLYLDTYGLPSKNEMDSEQFYLAIGEGRPVLIDNELHLYFHHFFSYVSRSSDYSRNPKKATKVLKKMGFGKKQIRYKEGGDDNWKTKRYWKIDYNKIRQKYNEVA